MSLYTIDAELTELLNAVANGEEVDSVAPLLELNAQQHADKMIARAYAIKSLESEAKMYGDEIKRLQTIKKRLDGNADYLRTTTLKSMQDRGITEPIKGPTITLSIPKPLDVCEIIDIDSLPSDYKNRPPETAKKNDIKAALKAGKIIAGARLSKSYSLSIK